jgi:Ras-related GTP-binding protein C/D
MENSFLFDMRSSVILASDNRHRNDATLNQLTEYVAQFSQFRELYKSVAPPIRGVFTDRFRGLKYGGNEGNGAAEDGKTQERASWDEEDPEEPWAFQATRVLPKTTLVLWQLTP